MIAGLEIVMKGDVAGFQHPLTGHVSASQHVFQEGHHVVRNKRFPVYNELGLYKRSPYQTYSCRLETSDAGDVELLEQLCRTADLGFEVWSNAVRQYSCGGEERVPEYYGPDPFPEMPEQSLIVAIAARREKHVLQVLRSWNVISLSTFSNLESYR